MGSATNQVDPRISSGLCEGLFRVCLRGMQQTNIVLAINEAVLTSPPMSRYNNVTCHRYFKISSVLLVGEKWPINTVLR